MSAPAVSFRPATVGDAEAMAELEAISLPDAWNRAEFSGSLGETASRGLLAEAEGALVGLVLFRHAADEAEILRLAIDPAWRRAGIGGELVGRALLDGGSRGAATFHLEVRERNLPARRLYERLGFAETGRRPRYYGDGEDAILYRRELPPLVVGAGSAPVLSSIPSAARPGKESSSMPNLDDLRQDLLATNDDFRRLVQEHQECEERLQELLQKTLPSQEDEAEEKRLKIHKPAQGSNGKHWVREHRLAV
ncbi:MAG: ribosomal protein S18-alanine N-acetyltransferase [Thermoanaerobaculia bacterium]